jgi:hypothetical protein
VRSKLFLVTFLVLALALTFLLPARFPATRALPQNTSAVQHPTLVSPPRILPAPQPPSHTGVAAPKRQPNLKLPIHFEPAPKTDHGDAQFVGRGGGLTVLLTDKGMRFIGSPKRSPARSATSIAVEFSTAGVSRRNTAHPLTWSGAARLPGATNYFLGNDPARWRTHVPQFATASARDAIPGVDLVVYGHEDRLEYDLRVAPGTNPADLRLKFSGADQASIDATGDLVLRANGSEIQMRKPVLRQSGRSAASTQIDGEYVLEADGTASFRVGIYDPRSTLIIDPSLSVGYATFLGGAGEDSASSIAFASGMVYIGGTTTSAGTFVNSTDAGFGPEGGNSDFFIAEIDPNASGPSSLKFLTFIGGSGTEAGGEIAVDTAGNVAILGTTTSPDYPVNDGSVRTTGLGGVAVNDATITEIDKTFANLVYSAQFGGNGNEAAIAPGGIAFDSSGNIFVAMDTASTNLTTAPTTAPGPFQATYGGGDSDGFLAIFRPVVTAPTTHLKYCTYLGINAQATLTSVAVDSVGNAYLAGYTSNPLGTMVTTNGFQTTFGGGTYNGFIMKILPSGNGIDDLSYGTFLGGSGTDEILAIAVGGGLPGTVYVTGSAQSANFPVTNLSASGTIAPFQSTLKGNANAFLSVVGQLANGATKLTYSSYLGGSQTDAGLGIFYAAPNQIYIAGSAKSWDLPWIYNFQPFSGDQDAFVAEMDPTTAGAASLIYATPLGGSAAAGASASAQANGIAVDTSGNFYIAGATNAANFPIAGATASGVQPACASCQMNPPLDDAFVVQGILSSTPTPGISFNLAKVNFGSATVGATTVPQAVAVINTGGAPLTISAVNLTGANQADFSLLDASACTQGPIDPGQKCSFEVGFVASIVGPEEAFVTVTDNTPSTSQSLAVVGEGAGPFAMVSPGSVNFGTQPINTRTFAEITLTNSGNQALSFSQTLGGPDSSQFIPASAGNSCPSAANSILAAGQSCVVQIYFAPTTTGTLTGEVVFVDNSGGATGSQQTVILTGVGTGAAPVLAISPTSINFGSQAVGVTSATQLVTFSNNGSSDLNISSFTITGGNSTSFGYTAKGANACTLPTAQLVAGASCTLSVDFIPTAAGAVTAALTVVDNAQGAPQSVALSGNGGTTGVSISPTSFTFAPESVGIASAPTTANIKNTGTAPLSMTVGMTGADPADFSETDNCSQMPVGAGQTCMLSLTFTPKQAGSRSAVVQISDNAPGNPQTIPLSGTAVQATAAVAPAGGLNFASQLAGTAGTAQNVTVTNSGSGGAVLSVSSATLSQPGDFTLASNCKTGVAAGSSCTIGVTFTPPAASADVACGSTAGNQTGVLKIFDNDPASPQTVNVSGMVTDYCLVPPGAITASVTAGGTAQFTVDAQATGYSGTITLTCSATITQGTCSVSPASVSFSGNAPVPVQVSVTTTANTAAAGVKSSPANQLHFPPKLIFVAALSLLLFVAGLFGSRGSMQKRTVTRGFGQPLRFAQSLILLFGLSLMLAACFGGSANSVTVPPGGTPAGMYPITITATTSTGATRTIGLTLTVQ